MNTMCEMSSVSSKRTFSSVPRSSWASLLLLVAHHSNCHSFTPLPSLSLPPRSWSSSHRFSKSSPPPLPTSDDPLALLGLSATPTMPDLKRAYRKRAMQYHPDIVLDQNSTASERQVASANFARINAAYEQLLAGSATAQKKTSSGGYSYQPPHRRASSQPYSPRPRNTTSTNTFDDSTFDTATQDSFGAIFSDLISGVAGTVQFGASAGVGSIVGDFIDFLEKNVDGFQLEDEKRLIEMLTTAPLEEVAEEMDETQVLVTSLQEKRKHLEDELRRVQADFAVVQKYSEKLDLQERMAEIQAREKVVKSYLTRGKKRLVRLTERYKDLIVQGHDKKQYGASSSGYDSNLHESWKNSASSSSFASNDSSSATAPESSTTSPSTTASESKSWRSEGFSGTGRRSSSSRRSGRDRSSTQTSQQQIFKTAGDETSRGGKRSSSTSENSSQVPLVPEQWSPPHRRSQSFTERVYEDKRRLRELKVEDEFEKLRKEMGL